MIRELKASVPVPDVSRSVFIFFVFISLPFCLSICSSLFHISLLIV